MGKKYNNIAHNLDMRWVNATYKLLKPITIDRTFKEIKSENIDILRSDKRKMLLEFPHSSLDDMVLPQYDIIKYNVEYNLEHNEDNDSSRKAKYPITYPITFAGSNLFFRWYLKKVGCAKFRRDGSINLEETNYAAYLLGEENRDVLFFPGFVKYEERGNKSGRTWDGRIQRMSPIPVMAAKKCYEKYNKDIDFIIINITYEPLTPEEGAFQLLMDGEFSKKWYYRLAKKTHVKQIVTFIDFLQFVRPYKKLNITAHISFYGPYSFKGLYERFSNRDNPTQEICNHLEKEGKSKIKLTAHDVWAYSIKSDGTKEAVSSEATLWNYVSKSIENGMATLLGENSNGRTYRNDEIMKNASELIERLDGKVDLSLVKGKDIKDILSEVKKSKVVFRVNDSTTTVNDEYLFNYHRNRVAGLVENLNRD
jgi:hypothetical protein